MVIKTPLKIVLIIETSATTATTAVIDPYIKAAYTRQMEAKLDKTSIV